MPPPLAITDVRYVGDPVAVVIAETRYLAEDACELIEVDYEPSRPVVDYATAAADTENIVHAGWGLESNAMVGGAVHAALPRPRRGVRGGRARRGVRRRAEPLHLRCPMETPWHRGLVDAGVATSSRSSARRSRCTRPATSSPATSQIPEGNVHVTAATSAAASARRCSCTARSARSCSRSFLLGRPVKWIEDRRENLLSAAHSRNEFAQRADGGRRRRHHPGHHRRRTRATSAPTRLCPAAMDPMLLPGPYKIPRLGFSIEMMWTNTMGKARVPGAVDVRDHGARDGDRPRRREIGIDPAELRRRNLLAAADLPFTAPERQRVPGDHPARDARAGARDPRLRGVPQGAGRGARRGSATSASASARTWSRRRWAATRCATEAATVQGRDQRPRRSPTSAPRRTARASRPRWRRSSPSTSAWRTTTSPSCRPTRSRRRTDPAPAGAAPRSSPAAPRARRPSPCARRCCTIAAHMMEAAPDDLEIAESVVSVRGTPSKSVTLKDVAKQRVRSTRDELPRRDRQRARGDGAVPAEAVPHVVERHARLRRRDRRRDAGSRR